MSNPDTDPFLTEIVSVLSQKSPHPDRLMSLLIRAHDKIRSLEIDVTVPGNCPHCNGHVNVHVFGGSDQIAMTVAKELLGPLAESLGASVAIPVRNLATAAALYEARRTTSDNLTQTARDQHGTMNDE